MTNLTLRPPLPRSLYLETTSRCNSLCETCILTFGGREPAKDLAWEEFRAVVDQFPALDRVLLHGIGEPLLNRHLAPMVAHLKRRDAQVIFNTNAITLDGRVADALIEAGLDELRVSLDASTRSTYTRVRGVDAFEKVVANLERFATLRRERGVSKPAVSLWFTALQENIEEIPGLVPLAAARGGGVPFTCNGSCTTDSGWRGPTSPSTGGSRCVSASCCSGRQTRRARRAFASPPPGPRHLR